jgi:hypothetical protein
MFDAAVFTPAPKIHLGSGSKMPGPFLRPAMRWARTARLRFICFPCRGGQLALLVVMRLWCRTDMSNKPILFVVKADGNWTIQAEWPDGTVEEIKTFKRELQALDWLTWQSQTWLAWRETDFSSCG